jgi:hypothetical protein
VLNSFVLLIQAPSYLEVISITAALLAWDLSYFIGRLEKARTPELARILEVNHLRRLLIITGVGLLLMGAAILLRIRLSFAIALLLGGAGLLALIQVVSRLGHHVEKPRRDSQIMAKILGVVGRPVPAIQPHGGLMRLEVRSLLNTNPTVAEAVSKPATALLCPVLWTRRHN